MSGHNKWSKIKRKKEVADQKKSREFSKLVRLIKVEARAADGNIESPGLKAAIDQAKAANMPKDNIERAIQSATGEGAESFERVTYEVYGPGGVALVIEALTDNTNRTGSEIKHLLSQKGLALAEPGSALWAFERDGNTWKPKATAPVDESAKEEIAALVEALEEHDDVDAVYTNMV